MRWEPHGIARIWHRCGVWRPADLATAALFEFGRAGSRKMPNPWGFAGAGSWACAIPCSGGGHSAALATVGRGSGIRKKEVGRKEEETAPWDRSPKGRDTLPWRGSREPGARR
jgi:hypothetical protein